MAQKWRTYLLLLVLVGIPIVFNVSLINLGIDDLDMVRHLDPGEFELYVAQGASYDRGPFYGGLFNTSRTYPKLFYNLAGVFLYPYSLMVGQNFKTVLVVWRGMNMFFGVGALLALFFLLKVVFHSKYTAFLGVLLFGVSSEFLRWTANVRPNPLEQMLIFLTLLWCVHLCRDFSYRSFLAASLLGALAFSTKYGGTIFVVFVPALSVYAIWLQRQDQMKFATVLERQVKFFRIVFPFIVLTLATGFLGFVWAFHGHGWDAVSLFYHWSSTAFPEDFLPGLLSKLKAHDVFVNAVGWGCLVGTGVALVAVIVIRQKLNTVFSVASVERPVSACTFLLLFFLGQTMLIYVVIYFLSAPAYSVHPDLLIAQFGLTIWYTVLGGSYGWGQMLPLVERLRITGGMIGLSWIAFAPLLMYSVFLAFKERGGNTAEWDGRMVLYVYCGVSLVLFVLTRQVSIRHILPAVAILYAFMSDGVVRKLMKWRSESPSHATAVVLLVLLSFGISASATDSIKVWHDLRNKNSDIGFEVGDWLKKTYSSDIRILTDSGFFYIPLTFSSVLRPKFWGGWGAKRTGRMSEAEWQAKRSEYDRELARNQILTFNPDVIVLGKSEHHIPLLDIAQLVASDPLMRSREYRIVKVFQARPERGGGLLKWQAVFIYEKASTKRVVGSDVRAVHKEAQNSLSVS